MKIEEALAIIEQACAAFVGTLKDHQTIQQAIELIKKELERPTLIMDEEKVD